MSISVRDIAWLAGLIEGEGCISIKSTNASKPSEGNSIHIHVGMTDRDVIERAGAILGTRMLGPYAASTKQQDTCVRKPQYRVVVTQSLAASWLMTIYPLLGERRREAARGALTFWREKKTNGRMLVPHRVGHPQHGERFDAPWTVQ